MKPNLIIGGASKSGTTALYFYLRQHPGFNLPRKKELHFFSRDYLCTAVAGPGDRYVAKEIPNSFQEYLSYFSTSNIGAVAVDISPSYLFFYETASEIRSRLPDVKIIFILRNPVDKIFSQYMHLVGSGRETLPFEEALGIENERKTNGYSDIWRYRESGFYSIALRHYIEVFGAANIGIFFFDDFLNDWRKVLKRICKFAGADEDYQFRQIDVINRSGRPRSSLVGKLISPNAFTFMLRRFVPGQIGNVVRRWIREKNTGDKMVVPTTLRLALLQEYTEDIRIIERIAGRATGWLNEK